MHMDAKEIEARIRKASELRQQMLKERDARLEADRERLTSIFEKYKKRKRKIKNPDSDVLFLCFRDAFMRKDYAEIVKVGDLIDDEMFYFEHGQVQAYYLYSKKQLQEK
jgi:hypothetical protein